MSLPAKLSLAWRATRQLGVSQTAWYTWYQLLLRSGYLRLATASPPRRVPLSTAWVQRIPLPAPQTLREVLGEDGIAQARAAADEITEGKARLFGGPPLPLNLTLPPDLAHWTRHDTAATLREMNLPDVKYLWEPARFGWVFALGRASRLTGNPVYAAAFWEYAETFWESNPPYRGPNWESAQEVALRLMALAWAGTVFADAPASTPERMARLTRSLAVHAARIPPTLAYARAQNNNHLLSEAAGLLTAAALLPEHPRARRWRALGLRWWRWGLVHQVAPNGEYIQHSANYHRLMLQLSLWMETICPEANRPPQRAALERATRWLLALCDPQSGGVPNLGPNDGAYIFPLTGLPFGDYRPVLQAAARAFLKEMPFPPGAWDEMAAWFSPHPHPRPLPRGERGAVARARHHAPQHLPRGGEGQAAHSAILRGPHSWAYLRAARLTSRPGHADQLHLDLWSAGRNLLLDAGTYLYNAPPPWDNALTHAAVHNTVTVDGLGQMTRAGRFLYLDWAQGEIVSRERAPDGSRERLRARHDGYRRLGILHERSVTLHADGRWVVEDLLTGPPDTPHTFRLHWLVADGEWKLGTGDWGLGIGQSSGVRGQSSVVSRQSSTVHRPPSIVPPRHLTVRLPEDGLLLRLTLRLLP
ncbi:MAG TPA: alginate lyase family protein, partial [Chloroflexi bacterium]|nr:alginate lyase family protein [Chloroflexota bacterium]